MFHWHVFWQVCLTRFSNFVTWHVKSISFVGMFFPCIVLTCLVNMSGWWVRLTFVANVSGLYVGLTCWVDMSVMSCWINVLGPLTVHLWLPNMWVCCHIPTYKLNYVTTTPHRHSGQSLRWQLKPPIGHWPDMLCVLLYIVCSLTVSAHNAFVCWV